MGPADERFIEAPDQRGPATCNFAPKGPARKLMKRKKKVGERAGSGLAGPAGGQEAGDHMARGWPLICMPLACCHKQASKQASKQAGGPAEWDSLELHSRTETGALGGP